MFRKALLIALLVIIVCPVIAQLKSPEEFLGYKLGEKYTPHWKVISYFNHVASAVPAMVKTEQYGKTNEGRDLLFAFISSAENIPNLDRIRLNNLRIANIARDKAAPIMENAPAIVWLSYNVHGNETSSSEASMLTLYSLVDPSNSRTKEWLKNTVVVIDPCVNPDGRDRYVNWFNSIVGKDADPRLAAREHREPWPGGRTNHYNFDLNRDWAWQTQVESQQRIKVYNQWLPHVHVDFHEQGINAPYYFAPAAQPFHEVITPWQSEFQTIIGKNHVKYFDANGWLYFTREIFDLYYPSYGDTWPTFNGSIGMTYEQGGGSAGGLSVVNDEGDTLTLLDRISHHHTTSLSTIEVSSKNAAKLNSEFRKFFNDAVSNGVGEYKSYIIKNKEQDREKIRALLNLLQKNEISYGYAQGNAKGYSYVTGSDESFSMQSDLVIPSTQPKSALVKVLFEPRSRLADSLTYDITAWSIPYAYGLTAWASKEKINISGNAPAAFVPNPATDAYGYVMRWQGISSAKTVAALLKKNVRLRFAEAPFEVNGQSFDRGSILILKQGNTGNGFPGVTEIANRNEIKLYPVTTGFVDKGYDFGSNKVHVLRAPRVVVLTGEGVSSYGAGEIWHFFERQLEYPVTLVNANDFSRLSWNSFDLLIMPSGTYRFLSEKASLDALKDWVNKGGRIVALEDAVDALAKAEFGIKVKKPEEKKDEKKTEKNIYDPLKRFGDRERDFIPGITPGSIYKVELDTTHPLAYGYSNVYYTLKMDESIYEFMEGGWNVGVIKKNNQVAGFVGAKLKDKLKDGLLFGSQTMGRGNVTYLVDNVMFRSFWENGKLMMCNAVFFVGQ